MRKLLLLFIITLGFVLAETPVKGNAYIISSMNVNATNEIQQGQTYSLVPKVVIYNGESYVGSVTPYTGCIDSDHYTNGILDTGWKCMVGLVNDLTTGGADKALSAEQGKILNDDITSIENKMIVNYAIPTSGSVGDVNGIQVTYNEIDSSYTVNGTATGHTNIVIARANLERGKTYKLIGCPEGGTWDGMIGYKLFSSYSINQETGFVVDAGDGAVFNSDEFDNLAINVVIQVNEGVACNNLVFKPMITDNLSLTYDDYLPYNESYTIGLNSGTQLVLLWENALPENEMADTNFRIENDYKLFVITSKSGNTTFLVNSDGESTRMMVEANKNGTSIIVARTYKIVDGVFHVGLGHQSGIEYRNDLCIPWRIYGLK